MAKTILRTDIGVNALKMEVDVNAIVRLGKRNVGPETQASSANGVCSAKPISVANRR